MVFREGPSSDRVCVVARGRRQLRREDNPSQPHPPPEKAQKEDPGEGGEVKRPVGWDYRPSLQEGATGCVLFAACRSLLNSTQQIGEEPFLQRHALPRRTPDSAQDLGIQHLHKSRTLQTDETSSPSPTSRTNRAARMPTILIDTRLRNRRATSERSNNKVSTELFLD